VKSLFAVVLLSGSAVLSGETIALVGGTVHPVSGPDIPKGTVVISDGKIAAVGANVPVPAGAKVVDVSG
jgi:imidazolonepropionase-like amidohydrolase